MRFTKVEVAGCDFLIASGETPPSPSDVGRWLDRRQGIGGEGLLWQHTSTDFTAYAMGGEGCFGLTAALAAAKYVYAEEGGAKRTIRVNGSAYPTVVSAMRNRVLCVFGELPPLSPRPMEQLKYYYGVRGEVLRACLPHPRVSVYELCGTHAVFLVESLVKLRRLNLRDICKRLDEVLFYDEELLLHFVAFAGEGNIALRTWRSHVGEIGATGEGAAVAAYAAAEAEWVCASRTIVRLGGGAFCVELCGTAPTVCAKCETIFQGELE